MIRDGHLFTNMIQLKSLRQEKERYGAQSNNKGASRMFPVVTVVTMGKM